MSAAARSGEACGGAPRLAALWRPPCLCGNRRAGDAAAVYAPFDDYILHILVETSTYAIAVFGLTVVLGLCGQINLAQAAFFGLAPMRSGSAPRICM